MIISDEPLDLELEISIWILVIWDLHFFEVMTIVQKFDYM